MSSWRVIPGTTHASERPYWMIGRDERGGIRFVLTAYSRIPRRWKVEKNARDHCAQLLRQERAARRAKAQAERLARVDWPFPESYHDWSKP